MVVRSRVPDAVQRETKWTQARLRASSTRYGAADPGPPRTRAVKSASDRGPLSCGLRAFPGQWEPALLQDPARTAGGATFPGA